MGTFLKGINGAFSGKVGNNIGSRWRSVDYMRSLPRPSNKPATEAQLAQRAKFGLAVAFLSPIKDLLNIGFSDLQQTKSTGYNVALRHMLKEGIVGDYPNLEIAYEEVYFSRGRLAPLFGLDLAETNPGEATLTWQPKMNSFNAFADDEVIVLVYNKNKAFFDIVEETTRADGSLNLELPTVFSGDELSVWIIMAHREGKVTSNSQYAGTITVS
ncbi:DUF6266 family protein [Olivibacter sp. XZL3]|uniref:DUF6266 family protein n=1 Tax=Olivibacter sp. XZL3 TaxID=1735116 RepID=UPI001064CB79|nr:DUF6266 family protein [Olivibacter sp. XZL3]